MTKMDTLAIVKKEMRAYETDNDLSYSERKRLYRLKKSLTASILDLD